MYSSSTRRGDRRGQTRRTAFAIISLLVFERSARAGDLEDLLSENLVSGGASQSAQTSSDVPATTVSITAADIRRYGIRSLAEAINVLGMGLITQDPLHSVETAGRGVQLTSDFGNHVLLVVDGHAMNEPWDGTAYLEQGSGVPIEMVDHIELILGPGSVLYGGNAMLGVVNVITKSASSYGGLHLIAEGVATPQQGGKRQSDEHSAKQPRNELSPWPRLRQGVEACRANGRAGGPGRAL